MAFLNNFKSQFKLIGNWLFEVWHYLGTIFVIGIALFAVLYPCTSEPRIRITGLVLQLFGIFTVIWGISETRALFGHPSFSIKAKNWLKRFPSFRQNLVINATGSSVVTAGCKAEAYITHGAGDNPTVESRLDAIEKNIYTINNRIDNTKKEVSVELNAIADKISQEERLRALEVQAIREKLEATGTGGIYISIIGVVFLFFGTMFSTASSEIADWLKCDIEHPLYLKLTEKIGDRK